MRSLVLAAILVSCAPAGQQTPPDVALAGLEPAVQDALRGGRERVLRDPADGDAWGELAMDFDVYDFQPQALSCYRRAQELAPSEFAWAYHAAVLQSELGTDPGLAADAFVRAAELRRDYAPLWVRLGRVHGVAGSLDSACEAYRRAVEVDPEHALAHLSLGRALLSRGDDERALRALEEAARLRPDDGATLAALARARRRLGLTPGTATRAAAAPGAEDTIGLQDVLRQAILERGVGSSHLLRRARRALALGDPTSAARLARSALQQAPGDPHIQVVLGVALSESGAHEQAATELGRALEHDPENVELRVRRATALARAERFTEADAEYVEAASRVELNATTEMNWGTVCYRLKDVARAREHYARAVELAPDMANAHGNLGLAYEELGERELARHHYERAVALMPGHEATARLRALEDG